MGCLYVLHMLPETEQISVHAHSGVLTLLNNRMMVDALKKLLFIFEYSAKKGAEKVKVKK